MMPRLLYGYGPRHLGQLGQDTSSTSDGGSRFIFSIMLLGLGMSLGFALGMSQGVRVSKG